MAELILMRHAAALPAADVASDFDRPLSALGHAAAAEAARQLAAAGVTVDRVLYSPARRTKDTAELIASGLALDAKALQSVPDLYEASVMAIRSTLERRHGGAGTLMIIGHNPGISDFGRELASDVVHGGLPPAGWWRLPFDAERWRLLTAGATGSAADL
jgi:phosphohistidine phosphatase